MKLRTLLDLARVSNLPTVWSNVLAGAVLGFALEAASPSVRPVVVAGLAGSLLYSGGMFLNDAFDAEIDARERPERPIPSGRIGRTSVFVTGFAMLAAALGLLVAFADGTSALAGLAIAIGVVVYDRFHKGVVWSPVVMGFCRAGLYVMGALAAGSVARGIVLLPALGLLLYVVGLTHVARFENASAVGRAWPALLLFAPLAIIAYEANDALASREFMPTLGVVVAHVAWTLYALAIALRGGKGKIPRAVVSLIAGISLVDAAFIALARTGGYQGIGAAFAAFGLTLFLQRWVRGT
jgi:4-hydroxybenzoate polyprenyltransferase